MQTEKGFEYSVPKLLTTEIVQERPIVGIRPSSPNSSIDDKCQCADCDSDDCGPNNPGGD